MAGTSPSVSVIVVSYNTRQLLAECLASVRASQTDGPVELLVVDNASTDGSPEMVRSEFAEACLIRNSRNVGFAAANNQALQRAQGRHLLLLNSDTALLPEALEQLRSAFARHPELGIAGPRLLNRDGTRQPSWGEYPSVWTEFLFQTFLFKVWPAPFPYGQRVHPLQWRAYRDFRWVHWVTGAALMLRREVWDRIGGLPEDAFMYAEDVEYCWRAAQAGFRIAYCPAAAVYHFQQGSARQDYSGWIANYTRGMLAYYNRHRSNVELRRIAYLVWAGSLLRRLVWTGVGLASRRGRDAALARQRGYACAARLARDVLAEVRTERQPTA
jgi:GT2 family glycosyltransferase